VVQFLPHLSLLLSCVGPSLPSDCCCHVFCVPRLVLPVMGQQGPDYSRILVGQSYRSHVLVAPAFGLCTPTHQLNATISTKNVSSSAASCVKRFRPVLNEHGITEQQYRVLRAIQASGPSAEQCHISSLAGVLARMEAPMGTLRLCAVK